MITDSVSEVISGRRRRGAPGMPRVPAGSLGALQKPVDATPSIA